MNKFILTLAAALLLAPSCTKINREENLRAEELASLVPIELTKGEQGVRDASNSFGLNTFRLLYGDGGTGDVAFSPLSLSLALAMTAEGAEGDTWKQFQDVIGWGSATKEDVGVYYQKMVAGTVLLLGTLSK